MQQASRLKVFVVQGCPLLKALPFYQRFPYLLPLDVTVFSSGWVTRFIEVLAPFEPRKLADAQVEALVSALKTYTVHLERFKNGLLEALKEASMDVNVSALLTLGQLGYFDASVNAALQGRLKHENGRFVQAASIALLCLQGQEVAPEVLERVESALSSPDKNLSQAATRALMGVSGWTEKLATPLSQQLSSVSSDAKKTQGILASLGEITVSIPAVIPAIEAVLSEKEPATQASALWVLGRMGVLDARFSQNLPYFQALGRNGVQFSAVLSHLARLDRDISRQFQGLMLPLCKSLPVPSVPAELVKQVKDPRWDQRKQAMVALRDLQGDSPEIRGIFVESARDISHHVRQLAVEGLAALPHPDAATSMAFTYALQDKERLVCEAGMQGFGNHPSLFQLETLQLMQALISTDSATSTRKIFAQTLSQLSQRFPKAFEQLLGLMQTDKYTEVKQAVMESLLTWLSFNGLAVYLEEVSAVTLEANAPRSGFFNANKPVARAPSQRPEVTPPARLTTQTTTLTSSRIPVVADDRANVPSVLFPNNFRYLEVLKRFRKTLWDTITTPHTVLETAALTRLLGEATTPLLKAVLLEAFEWLPFKLAGEQDVLKDVRLKLTLAKRVVSLSKKGKFDESAQSVLTDVQSFLQRQLADVTDGGLRQALQEASDRVRILRTIFAPSQAAA